LSPARNWPALFFAQAACYPNGVKSGTVGGAAEDAASPAASESDQPPAWTRHMKRSQQMSDAVTTTIHAVRSGDPEHTR